MDNYMVFLAQEETTRRLLGSAFDHWYELNDLDLDLINGTVSASALRDGVNGAIPSDILTSEIIDKCGLSFYPVSNPRVIGKDALENLADDNLIGARSDAEDLRSWLKYASDNCKKRTDLWKAWREKMQTQAGLLLEEDAS